MRLRSFCRAALLPLFMAGIAVAQDVQTNPPDNASPSLNNSTVQSETNHAITANGVIAAWNDSSQIPTLGTLANFVAWSGSSNGGVTFTGAGGGFFNVPPNRTFGDPAVVADGSGFFYLAGLGDNFASVGVARSTGTLPPFSFGTATVVAAPVGGQLDKELMSIDRTGGGFNNRIYLTATNLSTGRIVEAHSTSLSPPTFTAWQNISTATSTASMTAVAANGDAFAVWVRSGNIFEIVKSTNGGGAWVNPDPGDLAMAKVIATVTASPGSLATVGNALKIRGFPQIAIDTTAPGSPTRGFIYVVFHAHPTLASDNADIFFTRSTDNGVTWSAPRSISSGGAATIGRDATGNDNWDPAIAVSPVNGHIYVTFYDRREDTSAGDGDPANTKTRVYRALSTDAGQTFNVAPFGSALFRPIAGFSQAGASNNYWGEYNWATADASGLQFTWGDSRNLCAPPMAAPNPCSPSGRPDLDAYFHSTANLSGPDLFIKPWGFVTGEGATWQTPYIFVVDNANVQVNAQKGIVNHLRARVRNLGNAAAAGAVVHFKFSPAFAGFNESVMEEIGTVNVNFSAAGGGNDDQIVPIDWDLTNTGDTNGGMWPMPISAFDHFCVLVRIDLVSDINLSNNVAQNNFFNVMGSSPSSSPLSFLVVGPDKRKGESPALAQIAVNKLPEGFRASIQVQGVDDPRKGFRLQPGEIRTAKATFVTPKGFKGRSDVVASISLLLDGRMTGGISALLYASPLRPKSKEVFGPTKAPYWDVKPEDRTLKIRSEKVEPPPPPPMRTIPKPVKFRQSYRGSYEKVYETILQVLREQKLGPEFADVERGLINTRGVKLTRAEIPKFVTEKTARDDGFYWMSIWLEPGRDNTVTVGVDAWIATNEVEAPMGLRLHSNGTLERSVLTAVARALGQ